MPRYPDPDNVDPLRHERPVFGKLRAALLAECRNLTGEINELDDAINALVAQRNQLLEKLERRRRRLSFSTGYGRCADVDGAEQLPPIPANAIRLRGRRLRRACLALLLKVGRLALPQLHALLHLHGFAVDSGYPVKALADALGHEHDEGRAVRVDRGTYELAPHVVVPPVLWRGGPSLGTFSGTD